MKTELVKSVYFYIRRFDITVTMVIILLLIYKKIQIFINNLERLLKIKTFRENFSLSIEIFEKI